MGQMNKQFDGFLPMLIARMKKSIKEENPEKAKERMLEIMTDDIDALLIAETIRFGRYKSRSVPQENLLSLRELCRNRFYLMDLASVLERKVTALLNQAFPEFETPFDSTLTSIPGVGPVLGAVLLSEIRDISCFVSADKLATYAEVDPRVKQSGEMKLGGVHMSKRGSPYLRQAIWRASVVAVQSDPMFRVYCEKKSAEGMRYMNIIGHVTRKMTSVIFAVMRDNKIYEPTLPAA